MANALKLKSEWLNDNGAKRVNRLEAFVNSHDKLSIIIDSGISRETGQTKVGKISIDREQAKLLKLKLEEYLNVKCQL